MMIHDTGLFFGPPYICSVIIVAAQPSELL